MSLPTDRTSLKAWCLRQLGGGVVNIEISEEQQDDLVDLALLFYADYHMDGTEHTYYVYQLTSQDCTNKYITIPDEYIYVNNIFDIGDGFSTNNLFNLQYQIIMSDMYSMSLQNSIVPYYLVFQNLQFLEQLLVGYKPIRFNRRVSQLHIDMDWNTNNPGDFIVIEAYKVLDPTVYTKIWQDRWLLKYTTALFKRQWGMNLSKYRVPLLGGQEYNGVQIYKDGQAEVSAMEAEMLTTYSLPPSMLVG